MPPQPLPEPIARLLSALGASPRLVAHLTLVHDVACILVARLDARWPDLAYDREAVRLGAAVHDIGKVEHPEELTQPGHLHEAAGEALLRAHGFSAELARFARTHGQWAGEPRPGLEDLLVALADNWWRGRRDERLEAAVCRQIADQAREPEWPVFLALDDLAAGITRESDRRLAWQTQHAV
jgi:putative nucleotidyltransferase with HDIG domain